jgi:hypothetical protein
MNEHTKLSSRESLVAAGGLMRAALIPEAASAALGVYSGAVAGDPGTNFMRGMQKTGRDRASALHIGLSRLDLGGTVVHTGQFFFDDGLTDAVCKRTPYSTRGPRDTRNAADSIYRNGGSRSMLTVARLGTGYRGAITIGAHRG